MTRKQGVARRHKKNFLDEMQDAWHDAVRGFIKELPSAFIGMVLMWLILKVVGAL